MRYGLLLVLACGLGWTCAQAAAPPRITHVSVGYRRVDITFDQPMLTWNDGASLQAIRIQPAVTCKWYWTDDTTLTCIGVGTTRLFPPARAWRLDIGHGLWSQAGVELPSQQRVAESDRPELHAQIKRWHAGVPTIQLSSPAKVTAAAVARTLTVTFDGQPLHPQVEPITAPSDGDDDSSFRLRLPDLPAREGVLAVRVHPGLTSTDGPLPGTQDRLLVSAKVHEAFRLRTATCEPPADARPGEVREGKSLHLPCAPGQVISLEFSRTPGQATLAAIKAALPPGLEMLERPSDQDDASYWRPRDPDGIQFAPGTTVALKATRAGSRLRLRLPKGLPADDGGRLVEPVDLGLRIGDWPSSVGVVPGVLAEAVGATALPVLTTRNVVSRLQIDRLLIGSAVQRVSSWVNTGAARNVKQSPELPVTPASIRDHGGVVLAGARNEPDLGYAIAYAPFDVLASVSERQMLVWASRWGDGSPVAQASVELLQVAADGQARVAGTAVTAADGVAQMPLPKSWDEREEKFPLLLRVRSGEQVAVIPVSRLGWVIDPIFGGDQRGVHDNGSWRRLEDGDSRSFGVTDRPLYRPGETVHYRIWYRQRQGNHLRRVGADKVRVKLQAVDRDRTLRDWTATLDGRGGIDGVESLPSLLPDGRYCVAVDDVENAYSYDEQSGACFQVARFQAQPLWVQLGTDRKAVLAGQDLNLDLQAGYYSGDAAAGVSTGFRGLLIPARVEDTYPAFSGYTFISPYGGDQLRPGTDALHGITTPTVADGKGEARARLHLPASYTSEGDDQHRIVFGLLHFSADVTVPGKASASNGAPPVTWAQYPRYVGLKAAPGWLAVHGDPGLAAVVVDYAGQAVAGQAVQVAIERVRADADGVAPTVVGHCELRVDSSSACPFRPTQPGLYRFRASAAGAAPTVLERWIGQQAPPPAPDGKPKAVLKRVQAGAAGQPAKVEIIQPYRRASVLFTLEYGDVVQHWTRTLSAESTVVEVPLDSAWAPGVTLRAVVRASDPGAPQGGVGAATLGAALDLTIPRPPAEAITVKIDVPRLAPGQPLVLHLANLGGRARHATISVVDDSIEQQVPDITALADPERTGWLGSLRVWDTPLWFDLSGWKRFGNRFFVEPPRRRRAAPSGVPTPVMAAAAPSAGIVGRLEVVGSRVLRAVDTEPAMPVTTVTRADVPQRGMSDNFDVINHLQSSEGSGLATTSAHPRPALRQDFVDSAYWNPDLPLAAGEHKDVTIRLPDNLTRWRVLVWTSDEDDGFALRQATVETSLPVELRAGTPSRLYVGDHASASVSARNHGVAAASIRLQVQAQGAGVKVEGGLRHTAAGNAEVSQLVPLAPSAPGDVLIRAHAEKAGSADGLQTVVPVLAPIGEQSTTQAGWLDADDLALSLPPLPAGAIAPVLEVQVHRGLAGWQQGWLHDLRVYPNRCWEQTLSRAVGAALAIAAGRDQELWPDAGKVVTDALTVAPLFQDDEGGFHYFLTDDDDWGGSDHPALSAYTLRSFQLFDQLGHEVQRRVVQKLNGRLLGVLEDVAKNPPTDNSDPRWETAAEAAGAVITPKLLDDKALGLLWQHWDQLSWYGRSELVRALSRKPAFAGQARDGIARLRQAGTQQGLRRVIHDGRDFSFAMGSDLRDQCGVVGALHELDHGSDGELARRSLLRGLQDLYAGGTASLDTQSSAQCLLALREVARSLPADDQAWTVLARLGDQQHRLQLAAGQEQTQWTQPLDAAGGGALHLQSQVPASADLNYTAQLRYQVDLRQAKAHAVGMQLQRSYQVLRGAQWVELGSTSLHTGDWVRVTLQLEVPALRHFVAITDNVPGGLVSRDITLSQAGGAGLQQIADPGSSWFDTRQTGADQVRLYATTLPPGHHEVHYYAQAVLAGDYLAVPAVAELMYGRASRASTAAARVVIVPAAARR